MKMFWSVSDPLGGQGPNSDFWEGVSILSDHSYLKNQLRRTGGVLVSFYDGQNFFFVWRLNFHIHFGRQLCGQKENATLSGDKQGITS